MQQVCRWKSYDGMDLLKINPDGFFWVRLSWGMQIDGDCEVDIIAICE